MASKILFIFLFAISFDADSDEIEEASVGLGLPAVSSLCTEKNVQLSRRRPGVPVDEYALPPCDENSDQVGVSPWVDPVDLGPAVPDRWRIVQQVGVKSNLWDPYNGQNPLKGDMPVWRDDWFYSIIAISDTIVEPRRFPIPVGGSATARSGSLDTIGRGETTILAESLIIENVFYKGNTVFKPPDWEFRFTPVFNINRVHADEVGILNVDPDKGGRSSRRRTDTFMGVQALFVDKHLRNVSDRFDFEYNRSHQISEAFCFRIRSWVSDCSAPGRITYFNII
jgi:hypothetical protein